MLLRRSQILTRKVSQDEFVKYFASDGANSGVSLVKQYLNSSSIARSMGKEFLMFETNSASCGGFAGISNSFGVTLWALDYGMQMACSNFTHALCILVDRMWYTTCVAPVTPFIICIR